MPTPYASFENTRFYGKKKSQETGQVGNRGDLTAVRAAGVTLASTLLTRKNSHAQNQLNKGSQPLNPSRRAAFMSSMRTQEKTIVAGKRYHEIQQRAGKAP